MSEDTGSVRGALALDESEQRAMDHLLAFMAIVMDEWHLHEGNNLRYEFTLSMHALQGFISQHYLRRIGGPWGCWYEAQETP